MRLASNTRRALLTGAALAGFSTWVRDIDALIILSSASSRVPDDASNNDNLPSRSREDAAAHPHALEASRLLPGRVNRLAHHQLRPCVRTRTVLLHPTAADFRRVEVSFLVHAHPVDAEHSARKVA